jgi:hypothetical protein
MPTRRDTEVLKRTAGRPPLAGDELVNEIQSDSGPHLGFPSPVRLLRPARLRLTSTGWADPCLKRGSHETFTRRAPLPPQLWPVQPSHTSRFLPISGSYLRPGAHRRSPTIHATLPAFLISENNMSSLVRVLVALKTRMHGFPSRPLLIELSLDISCIRTIPSARTWPLVI